MAPVINWYKKPSITPIAMSISRTSVQRGRIGLTLPTEGYEWISPVLDEILLHGRNDGGHDDVSGPDLDLRRACS